MNKKLLFLVLFTAIFLNIFQNTYAIRAIKNPITVTQPDGSTVTILLHGDEFRNSRTTIDGYLVKKNSKGFFTYVNTDPQAVSAETNIIARDITKRTANDLNFLKTIPKANTLPISNAAPRKAKAFDTAIRKNKIQKKFPSVGSPKSLVILVNFSDKSFVTSTPQPSFNNLLNQSGYNINGGTGSARDYFMASSYGKFAPEFDVVGPYNLPKSIASYGANNEFGDDIAPAAMVVDACAAANAAGLDFSQYDTDNDGILDNVFVYYAGYNEAEGGPENTVWPHRWVVYTSEENADPDYHTYEGTKASVTFDGKRLYDYACTSELSGSAGSTMCGIGTFCHEFGHVIGMPDYYYTKNDAVKNTLNEWSIMDYGGYSNEGRTPPLYSTYDRFFLGWLTPQEMNSPIDLTLLPIYQGTTEPSNTNQQAYLLSATTHNLNGANPTPSEFFMLEYRKKTGWDAFLPGEGMLIWHIDYNQSAWDDNGPNNYTGTSQTATDHMRVYLQPLSGSTTTPGAAFTSGSFTPTTWSGTDINRAITAITKTTNNVSFKLMGGTQGPTIISSSNLTDFATILGNPSVAQSFTISGTTLTDNITIAFNDQSSFEMKLSSESTWSKTLTLAQTAGSINPTTINIRYNPASAGSHNAVITISSVGATSKTINVSGSASIPFDPNAIAVFPGSIDNLLQFPATTVSKTRTKVLNIKTTDILSALSVNITGTNAAMFAVSTAAITSSAANAANGTNINITYTPASTGSHTATLTISGGGLNPAKVITLNGEGK